MVFTEKCDVYSFGVLTMEVVIGKHPGDLLLPFFCRTEQCTKLKDILDHRIIVLTSDEEKDIILLMLVASACHPEADISSTNKQKLPNSHPEANSRSQITRFA
jgi:hypothetical protein